MGLRPRLNPRPSTNTRLKNILKYTLITGLAASALFLVIYYYRETKDDAYERRKMVEINNFKWTKTITIDHNKVSGNNSLINFPLLIQLKRQDLMARALGGLVENSQGYDIIFADELGKIMDFQVEKYDPDAGELIVWVRIPELFHYKDTRISMHYGNEGITENLSTPYTWDPHYAGVWHLDDDLSDASGHNNDGKNVGTNKTVAKVANGRRFNGNKNKLGTVVHINDHQSLDLSREGTVEAWIYVHSFQDWAGIIYKGDKTDFSDDAYFIQFLGGSEKRRLAFGIANEKGVYNYERSAIDLIANEWHHIAFTWDQEKIRLFVNGYDYGSKVNKFQARSTAGGINIGSQLSEAITTNPFDGIIDEVRISNISRSGDWIKTQFKNQRDPGSFFTVDEQKPGGELLTDGKPGNQPPLIQANPAADSIVSAQNK